MWDTADPVVSSPITYAESRAALAAVRRAGRHTTKVGSIARRELDREWESILQIVVTDEIVHRAGDLCDRHRLRGCASLHVASALAVRGPDVAIITLDSDVGRAALAEGLAVTPALR